MLKNITSLYKKLCLLFVIPIGFIFISCSCENFNSIKQEFDANEVVITGKILSVKPYYYLRDTNNAYKIFTSNTTLIKDYQKNYLAYIKSQYTEREFRDYTVQIEKKLKGNNLKNNIIIRTGVSDADCGYRFDIGKSYLIFASTSFWYLENKNIPEEDNTYITSLCNFNENMKTATKTVKIIEKY